MKHVKMPKKTPLPKKKSPAPKKVKPKRINPKGDKRPKAKSRKR